jgi:DNA-binding MarR family transcriptional regulator
MSEPHPTTGLDDTVHQRVRLGILAMLNGPQRCDFTLLRTELKLSDGNLNRHLAVLEAAGYVTLTKRLDGGRPRTWISATKTGKHALAAEVAALRQLLERVDGQI